MNECTSHPWGFTPDITFLMVLSLPAASMAWKMMRTDQRSWAYRRSCNFDRRLQLCFIIWSAIFLSFLPQGSAGSMFLRWNFLPSEMR